MFFHRNGKTIFKVELNAAEKRAMDAEIWKQILENDKKFEMDRESVILWTLHVRFGFGEKRLREFWETLYDESKKLREYYQMGPSDDGYLARRNLRSIGIDMKEWYDELGDSKIEERIVEANAVHASKD